MEDKLNKINILENSHQIEEKKFLQLKKYLEETIEIETLIGKLSSNQYINNNKIYLIIII